MSDTRNSAKPDVVTAGGSVDFLVRGRYDDRRFNLSESRKKMMAVTHHLPQCDSYKNACWWFSTASPFDARF
jgi:hypothetical protein